MIRPALLTLALTALFLPVAAQAAKGDDPVCLGHKDCEQAVLWRGAKGERLIQATFGDKAAASLCEGTELKGSASRLLLQSGGKTALIESFCPDGYGASGVGEDSLSVEGDALVLSRNGGAGDRWAESRTFLLPQLGLWKRNGMSFWAGEPNEWINEVDYDHAQRRFLSTDTVPARVAGVKGEEPQTRQALLIPKIAQAGRFDWRRQALGSCSLMIDGQQSGFRIHGDGQGASFKVLQIGEDRLLVEISDPYWVKNGKKPIYADHLELWLGPRVSRYDREEGFEKADKALTQWSISPFDGSVSLLRGQAERPVTAEAAAGEGGRRRVLIALPPSSEMLTLVYSDSDAGTRQDRLIATSQLKFGRSFSLGAALAIDMPGPGGEACAPGKNQRLDYRFGEGVPFALWQRISR